MTIACMENISVAILHSINHDISMIICIISFLIQGLPKYFFFLFWDATLIFKTLEYFSNPNVMSLLYLPSLIVELQSNPMNFGSIGAAARVVVNSGNDERNLFPYNNVATFATKNFMGSSSLCRYNVKSQLSLSLYANIEPYLFLKVVYAFRNSVSLSISKMESN